jgi:hypothetical protein
MRSRHRVRRLLAGIAILAIAAGCAGSGTARPAPTSTPLSTATPPVGAAATPGPAATPAATAAATAAPAATPAPTATAARASQVAAARCAETPDAAPTSTVRWNIPVVGGGPTIEAGQAVAFVTTGFSPTVTDGTDGTDGKPDPNACIDRTIGSDAPTMGVVVTFYQPGDYSITCRKVPGDMHTVVHVQ